MDEQQFAESRVGTVLHGKWRLERLLGVGGMAAVYEATHRIGRRDAIKILHRSVARSPELRARFEQEAHAVNRFMHPGAVEIRDIDTTEDGSPFLVMELLEGEPLSQRVGRPGGLTIDELLRFTDELLDVLAAAHASGIIHRDVKPDNLFVQSDGRLKVLDFGIARMREGTGKANRTAMGMRLGTLPYMPPEQIRGQPIDARADIFAVGAMVFRLVAGRRVHEAPTEAELAAKMLSEPAPPLSSVAPTASEGLCRVVDRALAFVREQRYPDAATMQADVQAVRSGRHPPFATEALATQGPPNIVRTPTAVLSTPGGLADAPTSAGTPDGLGAALRGDSATGATMMGPTAGVAGPVSPLAAPTGATMVGPAAGVAGPSAAMAAPTGATMAGAAGGSVGAAVVAGPATMVSPGVEPGRLLGGAAAVSAAGVLSGPQIAIVEAAPASVVESSAAPTLAAPPTAGFPGVATAGSPGAAPASRSDGAPAGPLPAGAPAVAAAMAPASLAAPFLAPHGSQEQAVGQPKPMMIVWLAAGAGLATLVGIVLLWWALSGTSESDASEAGNGVDGGGAGELDPASGTSQGSRSSAVGASGTAGRSPRDSQAGSPTGPTAPSKTGTSGGGSTTSRPAAPASPTSWATVGTSGGNQPPGDDDDDDKNDGKGKGKGKKDKNH